MVSLQKRSSAYTAVLRDHPTFPGSFFQRTFARTPKQSSNHEAYSYRPLDARSSEIRLLTLHPDSQKRAPLRCDLEHCSLDSQPKYAALSYLWGTSEVTETINVSGQVLEIRENLAITLHALRHPKKQLVLWVDSVCIHQQDNDEKGSQVAMMTRIYSDATIVLAWIGSESHDSGKALKTLYKMSIPYQDLITNKPKNSSDEEAVKSLTHMKEWTEKSLPKVLPSKISEADKTVLAILHLMSRPYWKRVWVQQELALGKNAIVICGQDNIELSPFGHGINTVPMTAHFLKNRMSEKIRERAGRLVAESGPGLNRLGKSKHESIPLRLLLFNECFSRPVEQRLQAADRRDLVYGLMSLAKDFEELDLKPDYHKTWQQVFQNLSEAYIRKGNVGILAYAQRLESCNGLPSWVPDWSHTGDTIAPLVHYGKISNLGTPYSASSDSQCHYEFSGDGSITLSGVYVDTIRYVGERWSSFRRPDDGTAETCGRFWEHLGKHNEMWIAQCQTEFTLTRRELQNMMFRALVADMSDIHGSFRDQTPLRWTDTCGFETLYEQMYHDGSPDPPTLKSYFGIVEQLDRPSLVTSQWSVGIGAINMQPNDQVWVILGAAVPFILRPKGDGSYEFVGDAYVHGKMDGEAMRRNPVIEQLRIV